MTRKRIRKAERKCTFCGGSIDGRPKKTVYCSGSCRARAWRATHVLTRKEHAVYEALVVIEDGLYAPAYKDGAIAVLQRIHDTIEMILKKGYQGTLPGIEG